MEDNVFVLHVTNVPMIKLLEVLAAGGFGIRGNAAGQFYVVSNGDAIKAPLTACDLLPGQMTAVATDSGVVTRRCNCGEQMFPVMMPPVFVPEGATRVELVQKYKCMSCGHVAAKDFTLAETQHVTDELSFGTAGMASVR